MSSITLVTMLYDIASMDLKHNSKIIGDYRRKTIDQYLEYGKKLIQLDVNLIIFVESQEICRKLLEVCFTPYEKRKEVRIIIKPFESFKWIDYLHPIHYLDEINPIKGRSIIKDTDYYRVCIWQKFDFLDQALKLNPFKSSHFGWIDFGCSYRTTWPSNMNQIVSSLNDKVKVSIFQPFQRSFDYRVQQSVLDAGFFTGSKSQMTKFIDLIFEEISTLLNILEIAPMEEQIMYKVIKDDPHKYIISWASTYDRLFTNWLK